MGKPNRRKREKKRKARRADRRREHVSLAYHGNKYKTEKLIPVHLHIEVGIYESFLTSDGRLTDRQVRSALEELIRRIHLRPDADWEELGAFDHPAGDEIDLVIWNVCHELEVLCETEPRPSLDNLIGVIRSVLGSIETWTAPGPASRGYLRYLGGFLKELGVSFERYPTGRELSHQPEEDDLLMLGRAWCREGDPEAAAEFRHRAEYLLRRGGAEEVVEVCQQLIGEAPRFEHVAELSALAIRAQKTLQASMG